MEDATTASPQRRISRYRSQRQRPQTTADDAPPVPTPPPDDQDTQAADEGGIARRRSRYHRKTAPPNVPDFEGYGRALEDELPQRPLDTRSPPLQQAFPLPSQSPPPPRRHDGFNNGARHVSSGSPSRHQAAQRGVPLSGRENSGMTLQSSDSQQSMASRLDPSSSALLPHAHAAQSPPPSGELFPPPRPQPAPQRRMDGPPTSDQIRATRSVNTLHSSSDRQGGSCFGLFKRKRADGHSGEKTPIARPLHPDDESQAIKVGGGGIVPGTDAPVSAVNAGDRRVLVQCGQSKMLFPVTPTTTSVDLIKSAATTMSERIDIRSAILLEHFGSVGLHRPLRRYEHVRDVMNSWDTDRQNSLLLVDPGTGSSEAELSLAGVPKAKPGDMSWLLHYSQKVGKWDKRMIYLKSDGQLTAQKDPKKPNEQANICHLSDFDIYTPTQEKTKKKVKPPKRYCFAIKSQQKTSMFQSTSDFVHFFCSADRATADGFHNAIQGWRSWYLVHVMGEGKSSRTNDQRPAQGGITTGVAAQTHHKMDSMDSHYQLGSFKPLVDMDQFSKRPTTSDGPKADRSHNSSNQPVPDTSLNSKIGTTKRSNPPVTLDRKTHLREDEPLANLARRNSLDASRQSLDQRRPNPDEYNDPQNIPRRQPTTRQSNPNDIRRSGSVRDPNAHRSRNSTDLQRSGSTRTTAHNKPLVDLTPQYREPPQHACKGRGHQPEHLLPGGLIDAATSPDDPINAPSSTDWRGRNTNTQSPQTRARSASRPTDKRKSAHQRPGTSRSPDQNSAFTGEGLLAGSQQGWGGGARGRGVMDGSRARGPMLDLSEQSRFAQGSLLDRVERKDGGPAVPTLDRQKWEERNEKTGEGF